MVLRVTDAILHLFVIENLFLQNIIFFLISILSVYRKQTVFALLSSNKNFERKMQENLSISIIKFLDLDCFPIGLNIQYVRELKYVSQPVSYFKA